MFLIFSMCSLIVIDLPLKCNFRHMNIGLGILRNCLEHCLLDSYREIVGRISSGRKQIIGAKESSGRSVSRNHREIGKIGRSGRNWLDLRPKLMKSALESVLVFGPKWVSYERSRRIDRTNLCHVLARAFFCKIPQNQFSVCLVFDNITHNLSIIYFQPKNKYPKWISKYVQDSK